MPKALLVRNASYADFGGGERFPVFLAKALKNEGYETVVVSRSEKILKFARQQKVRTVKGWWWPRQSWSSARALLTPLYIIWQIKLTVWYLFLLSKEKPDVIHIQSKDDFIAGTLAGKIKNKKVIWTDHADLKHIWQNLTVWHKNPIGKMVYMAAKLADDIVIVSNNEKNLITNNLPAGSKITGKIKIIYNGAFDEKSKYRSREDNLITFCIASRLVSDKGIFEAISAFGKLVKKHSQARLIILGTGPEASRFHNQAKSIPSIKFLGYLDEPLDKMAVCDIFLQPTYHEAFSVVLVEACMLGKAIIATDVGGNPEIIKNGVNGLLVESRNSDALYKAMLELYEKSELRKEFGRAARKTYLDKFDFATITKEYIELYET